MVSFIIINKNSDIGLQEVMKRCEEAHIAQVDQIILSLQTQDTPSQSIGINEIKKLQQKAYFKPLQSKEKAIIIKDAETLTTEAQSALLKIVEEPPAATYVYIITKDMNALLSTILSRCSVIQLDQLAERSEDYEELLTLFKSDMKTLSEKLVLAEKYGKQKASAITFLEQLLEYYHSQLHLSNDKVKIVMSMQTVQSTLQLVQTTNVNPRLALEYTLLSL